MSALWKSCSRLFSHSTFPLFLPLPSTLDARLSTDFSFQPSRFKFHLSASAFQPFSFSESQPSRFKFRFFFSLVCLPDIGSRMIAMTSKQKSTKARIATKMRPDSYQVDAKCFWRRQRNTDLDMSGDLLLAGLDDLRKESNARGDSR